MRALGLAAPIDALVKRWRAEIDRERGAMGRAETENEAAYRSAAAALRAAVWDPGARVLGAVDRVFVVPDGALQMLNFAALPAARGGYLVENGPLIHLVSTERDLAATPGAAAAGAPLLAIGDP